MRIYCIYVHIDIYCLYMYVYIDICISPGQCGNNCCWWLCTIQTVIFAALAILYAWSKCMC